MQPHDCVHPVGHGPRKPETSGAIGVCGHKAEVDELAQRVGVDAGGDSSGLQVDPGNPNGQVT